MTESEKIKIKRVLFTFITAIIISVPIWWLMLKWIFVPKDYISDGPTDFGYEFLFFLLMPLLLGISLIALLIISRKIFKSTEND